MTDQEYIDRHYITGGQMNDNNEPDGLPLLTPGETVVAVLIGIVAAGIALAALVAQIGLLP